jgi:hypothetical protein
MFRIVKDGSGWKLVGAIPSTMTQGTTRKFVFNSALLETLGCAGCHDSDHVRCPGCGDMVCLGLLSDLQQARVKARVAAWHGCQNVAGKAAA